MACGHCITESLAAGEDTSPGAGTSYLPSAPHLCFTGGEPPAVSSRHRRSSALAIGLDVSVVTGGGWVKRGDARARSSSPPRASPRWRSAGTRTTKRSRRETALLLAEAACDRHHRRRAGLAASRVAEEYRTVSPPARPSTSRGLAMHGESLPDHHFHWSPRPKDPVRPSFDPSSHGMVPFAGRFIRRKRRRSCSATPKRRRHPGAQRRRSVLGRLASSQLDCIGFSRLAAGGGTSRTRPRYTVCELCLDINRSPDAVRAARSAQTRTRTQSCSLLRGCGQAPFNVAETTAQIENRLTLNSCADPGR
jgi:hypothetical protein